MFCKNCGKELQDNCIFCGYCGQKIKNRDFNETMANETLTNKFITPKYEYAVHSKLKKKITVGIVVTLLVLFLVEAFFLFFNITNIIFSKVDTTAVSAKLTDDGTAYIPMFDGTCIEINDEVKDATISKDKKHIVVLLKNGNLYVTNKKQSSKTEIADNCKEISNIRNEGFFYSDINGDTYRILFSDFSSQKLGNNITYVVAENSTSVLYADQEGGIYTIGGKEKEANKIDNYTNSIELEAISDDGKISVWVNGKNDVQTIILNDGDDKTILGKVNDDYNHTYVTFTKDQGLVVISNTDSDCIWIKKHGQDIVEAKLDANPTIAMFTNKGYLKNMKSSDVNSLYISTRADTGFNVYNISLIGNRERILTEVSNYYIAHDRIIYTDTENTLFSAKLDGNSIANETKIASDVNTFELTDNGQYVYYMKDCEYGTGSLYCYKIGKTDPVKVATDVAYYDSLYGSYWMYTTYSIKGSSVFFFKDMEAIPNTYAEQGTLMVWNYGDEEATKISSEVVNYSVTSSLETGEINPKDFMFTKYSSVDIDNNIHADWMYYNGTEAITLADDVILWKGQYYD